MRASAPSPPGRPAPQADGGRSAIVYLTNTIAGGIFTLAFMLRIDATLTVLALLAMALLPRPWSAWERPFTTDSRPFTTVLAR
jgi:hypothetical protein